MNLKNIGVEDKDIDAYFYAVNSISNLQLLPELPNEEKNDTDFDAWFNEQYPSSKDKTFYRELHTLPDMAYSYSEFLNCINARHDLMAKELKDILL